MATLRVPDVVPSADEDCERLKKSFDGVSLCQCAWVTDCPEVHLLLFYSRAAFVFNSTCSLTCVCLCVCAYIHCSYQRGLRLKFDYLRLKVSVFGFFVCR